MYIDRTYFVGEINIPGTGSLAVQERLNFFIEKYEKELLRALLGYELYDAFVAGTKDKTEEQIDPKWKDLRDGKTYTASNSKKASWGGLWDSTTKQSPIANYVYYWWTRDKASHTSEVGETSEGDTAVKVSPVAKQARAWNEISDRVLELHRFMNHHLDVYPEWLSHDVCQMLFDFKPINAFNL